MPPSVSQLSGVAVQLVNSVTTHRVPESSVSALRACFPQGAYLSLTMGNTTPLGEFQLVEHSNFFTAGELVSQPVPIGASGCATADAIIGNQNFYFDEAVHKDKANQCRDFVRLSTGHDCAAIVAVPLPCHSKVGGDPRAACSHCGKSFMLAGRPLGCLLLGIRRNTNYSVREYLAKLVVFAGCLGPRLLALQANTATPPAVQPRPPMPQQQQPVSNPLAQRPPTIPQVNVAMASTWYNGGNPATLNNNHNNSPPPMPRRNSIDVGSLANAASWNPLTSPRTPTTAPPLTTSLAATLPTLPEIPQSLLDPALSVDPAFAADFAAHRTSLDWALASVPPNATDSRLSLDSQASAASMMMLGSRGSSVDGRAAAAAAVLLNQVTAPFGSASLPPMSGAGGFMTSTVPTNGMSFGGAGSYANGGYGGAFGSLSSTQLPPTTAAMAQQLGLLDLVNASPDKAQLLEALRMLQLQNSEGLGDGYALGGEYLGGGGGGGIHGP